MSRSRAMGKMLQNQVQSTEDLNKGILREEDKLSVVSDPQKALSKVTKAEYVDFLRFVSRHSYKMYSDWI